MQISWNIEPHQSPYLFRQHGEWNGLKIHRAKVMPGRLHEHADCFHKLNISLGGTSFTRKITESGSVVKARGETGGICVTPAGQAMSASWEKPLDNMGILVDPHFLIQTASENRFSPGFEFNTRDRDADPLIQHIGLALLAEAETGTPAGKLYAESLIQTLTLHLLKNYTTAQSVTESMSGGLSGYKLRRVTEFINANLEEDLSLSEIAETAGLSQFHFARAFRKSVGLTPQQYLMRQRIEQAKLLLTKNDLPIVEISLRTGFKNQSHFTTLFRKFTSLTPKHWREEYS